MPGYKVKSLRKEIDITSGILVTTMKKSQGKTPLALAKRILRTPNSELRYICSRWGKRVIIPRFQVYCLSGLIGESYTDLFHLKDNLTPEKGQYEL
ncbi:MAG TPA: hypothetical protein DEG17_08885 [Cyanobacteria bacterium UBA11149]|nr:hypothetical protein [Cyanobacteria bacterium UBA11366]HBS70477.1 hypothetical protein [Cyanobacteria bacterium UBA11153]HBW88970.1 hypothetical protein [Cyanobacteria bacterium UBA11149]